MSLSELNVLSAAILAQVESSVPECSLPSRQVEGSFDKGLYKRPGLAAAPSRLEALCRISKILK